MPEIRRAFACRRKYFQICIKPKFYIFYKSVRLALKNQNKYNWQKAETENGHEIFDGSFNF